MILEFILSIPKIKNQTKSFLAYLYFLIRVGLRVGFKDGRRVVGKAVTGFTDVGESVSVDDVGFAVGSAEGFVVVGPDVGLSDGDADELAFSLGAIDGR